MNVAEFRFFSFSIHPCEARKISSTSKEVITWAREYVLCTCVRVFEQLFRCLRDEMPSAVGSRRTVDFDFTYVFITSVFYGKRLSQIVGSQTRIKRLQKQNKKKSNLCGSDLMTRWNCSSISHLELVDCGHRKVSPLDRPYGCFDFFHFMCIA